MLKGNCSSAVLNDLVRRLWISMNITCLEQNKKNKKVSGNVQEIVYVLQYQRTTVQLKDTVKIKRSYLEENVCILQYITLMKKGSSATVKYNIYMDSEQQ